jgi:hypothetical protein
MRRGRYLALVCVVVLLAGCLAASPTPSSGPPVSGMALPTLSVWPLPRNAACAGVELGPTPFTLEGSRADGVYGLLASGKRIPTQWPPGYVATFDPELAVHAPDGSIVAKAGDSLDVGGIGGLFICSTPEVVQFLPF